MPGFYDHSSYQGVLETCAVPYDKKPPAKTASTHDVINASLVVPYVEPVKATWTTHDEITARYTVKAPRNKVGDTQIYNGKEYCFDGKKWFPVPENS